MFPGVWEKGNSKKSNNFTLVFNCLNFIPDPKMFFCPVCLDPCVRTKCYFFGQCISRNYKTTQCICPTCSTNDNYTPLCGDNGKTYANECWMRRDSCILQKALKPVAYKVCGVKENFDIVLAIDAARRHTDDALVDHVTAFLRAFVTSFQISRTATRFGILLYDADGATDILTLEQGVTAQSIENSLASIRSLGGKQGIHRLPNYLLSNFFIPSNRRLNAKRILVVMTTGLDENTAASEAFDKEAVNVFKDIRAKSDVDIITMVINEQAFRGRANVISTNKKDVLFMQSIMGLPGYLGDLEQIIGYKQGIIKI